MDDTAKSEGSEVHDPASPPAATEEGQQPPQPYAGPENDASDWEAVAEPAGMSPEDALAGQAAFNEYKNHLWTLRQSSYEHFDNAILTLSSALLALSVTFLKEAVPASPLMYPSILIGSWAAFAVVITSTLVSHIGTRKSVDCQLDFAERYYLKGEVECLTAKNPWTCATEICNRVSALFFIAAVVLTICFVSVNFIQENKRKEERIMASSQPKPSPAPSKAPGTTRPPEGPNIGVTPPPMPSIRPAPSPKPDRKPKK